MTSTVPTASDDEWLSAIKIYLRFFEAELSSEESTEPNRQCLLALNRSVLDTLRQKTSVSEAVFESLFESTCREMCPETKPFPDALQWDADLIKKLFDYAAASKATLLHDVIKGALTELGYGSEPKETSPKTVDLQLKQSTDDSVNQADGDRGFWEKTDGSEPQQPEVQSFPILNPQLKQLLDNRPITRVMVDHLGQSDHPHCLSLVAYQLQRNDNIHASCMDFSPCFNYLCCGYDDSSIDIWSLSGEGWSEEQKISPATDRGQPQSQLPYKKYRIHSEPLYDVKFLNGLSSKTPAVLSTSGDCVVRLLYFSQGYFKSPTVALYRGHFQPAWSLDVAPDSAAFATAALDGNVRLYVFDRSWPVRLFHHHRRPVDAVHFLSVAPESGGIADRCLLSAGSDQYLCLWALNADKPVLATPCLANDVTSLTVSYDGQTLVWADTSRHVTFWDVRMWKRLQTLSTDHGIFTTSFSSAGRTLVCSGVGGHLEAYRRSNGDSGCYVRCNWKWPSQAVDPETSFLTSRFYREPAAGHQQLDVDDDVLFVASA